MIKYLNAKTTKLSVGVMIGFLAGTSDAYANNDTNFGSIAKNITESVSDLPGLLSALAYLFGILLGVLGILKIKDHVENPAQTQLKDGAIRLAAGGALFALPIVFQAMSSTIGNEGTAVAPSALNSVNFDSALSGN
ncbi:MAG: hypothetical protein QF692_01095 [Alphaproteobacteria bacterium]|jgi:hypothetical protein|nr:hypothetical protein [Alphaproteobacteria bacterium]MDP7221839.1 hypothetical protein [Alphaproteobacteria bacterium]